MSRAAIASTAVFVVLLIGFLAARDEQISGGMRRLELPALDGEQITGIELSGAMQVRLVREGEVWTVRDPAAPERSLPADGVAIGRALDALAAIDVGSFVSARTEKHAELAIDEEQGTVVTVSRDDGENLSLVLGRRSKSGRGVLLRLRDSDEVFVGPLELGSVQLELDQWRDRALLDMDAAKIRKLWVERPGVGTVEFISEPDADGTIAQRGWRLADVQIAPEGFLLDGPAVAARTRSFAGLRALDFADGSPATEVTGLDDTAIRVGAETVDGSRASVRIGRESEASRVYAKVEGDDQVYLVSRGIADQLTTPLEELRDLALFRFEPDAVRELSITHPTGRVLLLRGDDGGWELVEPAELPLDYDFSSSAADGQLHSLVRTRAAAWLGPADEVDGDFSSPVQFDLALENGDRVAVRLGGEAGEEHAGMILADPGDGFAYTVSASLRPRYETPLDLFRTVEAPPSPLGGGQGLENLPPELRQQLEEAMRRQGAGGP